MIYHNMWWYFSFTVIWYNMITNESKMIKDIQWLSNISNIICRCLMMFQCVSNHGYAGSIRFGPCLCQDRPVEFTCNETSVCVVRPMDSLFAILACQETCVLSESPQISPNNSSTKNDVGLFFSYFLVTKCGNRPQPPTVH